VRQTVAMLRDHEHAYEIGPGYEQHAGGSVTERYWVRRGAARCTVTRRGGGDGSGSAAATAAACVKVQPYQVELVGVTCDPTLAVARGCWRKLRTGRAVPVAAQLRSFRLFAKHWPDYCKLVDSATLYHTGMDWLTHAGAFALAQPIAFIGANVHLLATR
jgi:hypothetical protein